MDISMLNPLLWVTVYIVLRVLRAVIGYFKQQKGHKTLVKKAEEYRFNRDQAISAFLDKNSKLMPSAGTQQKIFDCESLRELQDGLDKKHFTSVELLMHYANRCKTYGVKLNVIADINFEPALTLAKQCDELRKDAAKMKKIKATMANEGLLFGIPVSVKEHMFLKGTRNTIGCINTMDYIHQDVGIIENLLVKNGGIPFVKTNIPQLLLSMESENRLYGRCLNPINLERTPGGSSGGCSGIVAAKASPLSIGSDIGGSVRGPASFVGIYGFKITGKRFTGKHMSSGNGETYKGQEQILPCVGPLATCMDDTIAISKMFLNSRNDYCDPTVPPLKFRDEIFDSYKNRDKFRLGYFVDNSLIESSKPVSKAMLKAIETLEKEGHKMIPIDTTFLKDAFMIYMKILTANEMNLKALGDENFIKNYKNYRFTYHVPTILKPVLAKILSLIGERRLAMHPKCMGIKDAMAFNKAAFSKIKLHECFEKIYKDKQLDGIISPTFPTPALKHGEFKKIGNGFFYCSLWNLVDHPSCVIPRVHIVEAEDTKPEDYSDSIYGNDSITKGIRESLKGSEGLPIAIQISTLPFHDEQCLGITKKVNDILIKNDVLQKTKISEL